MKKLKILVLSILLLSFNNIFAAEHQIKMLNGSSDDMFKFEPAVLKIKKGDTVKWIATEPTHNTASIKEMLPKGAKSWNGKMNEEISVKFDVEGLYGYACTPHVMFGMVGLIIVGDPNSNLEKSKAYALKQEGKWVANKGRFSKYFNQVK